MEEFRLNMEKSLDRLLSITLVVLNPDRKIRECRLRYMMSLIQTEVALLGTPMSPEKLPLLPSTAYELARYHSPTFSLLSLNVGIAFPADTCANARASFFQGFPQRRLVAFENASNFAHVLVDAARTNKMVYLVPKWHEFASMLAWMSPLKRINPDTMVYLSDRESFFVSEGLVGPVEPPSRLSFSSEPSLALFGSLQPSPAYSAFSKPVGRKRKLESRKVEYGDVSKEDGAFAVSALGQASHDTESKFVTVHHPGRRLVFDEGYHENAVGAVFGGICRSQLLPIHVGGSATPSEQNVNSTFAASAQFPLPVPSVGVSEPVSSSYVGSAESGRPSGAYGEFCDVMSTNNENMKKDT